MGDEREVKGQDEGGRAKEKWDTIMAFSANAIVAHGDLVRLRSIDPWSTPPDALVFVL